MGVTADNGEIDYSKSTNAYPMDKEPQPLFVDSDIDYSKSTGAYPMYDEHVAVGTGVEGGVTVTHTVEHVGSDLADVAFPTPGPISTGPAEAVTAQRAELGLSADPSGDSDVGYEARPSTVSVPGADGVDRTQDQADIDAAASMAAASDAKDGGEAAATKTVSGAKTKVVKPPAKPATEGTSTAQGK